MGWAGDCTGGDSEARERRTRSKLDNWAGAWAKVQLKGLFRAQGFSIKRCYSFKKNILLNSRCLNGPKRENCGVEESESFCFHSWNWSVN